MKEHHIKEGIIDQHDCPRIFGPPTNFKFKKMVPMSIFIDLLMSNSMNWLRLYTEKEEENRIIGHENHIKSHIIKNEQNKRTNREWIPIVRSYLNYGFKQSYLHLPKMKKYGVEEADRFYCYADMFPPNYNLEMTIQSKQV
jgi:hypothetical protein